MAFYFRSPRATATRGRRAAAPRLLTLWCCMHAPHAPGCACLEWRRYSTARSAVCRCAERALLAGREALPFPRARANRIRVCSLLHASRQTLARQTQCRKTLCRHAHGAAPRAAGRCEGGSSARAGASESHSSAAHAAHDPHHHCTRDVARSCCSRGQDCALVPVLCTYVQSRAKNEISAPCQGLQVEHRRQIRHA